MAASSHWQPPQSQLRASDAERHSVATFLRDRAVEGRLTPEELDERVGRALTAVTRGELERLIADLPRAPARRTCQRSPSQCHALVPVGIAAFVALSLPGLMWGLLMTVFVLGVVLAAVVAAAAVALAPFLLVIAFAVSALRRHGRY
jgi:hypothetical protein